MTYPGAIEFIDEDIDHANGIVFMEHGHRPAQETKCSGRDPRPPQSASSNRPRRLQENRNIHGVFTQTGPVQEEALFHKADIRGSHPVDARVNRRVILTLIVVNN